MPSERNVALVADIKASIERAQVAIGTNQAGLSVAEFQKLRRALRPADVKVQVVKNTLAAIAAEQAGRPELSELLKGPTTLTLGFGDPVAPARLLMEHIRAERLELPIHGGWIDGQVLSPAEVEDLASTPPREQLVANVVGKLRSPMANLAGLLQTTMREFARLVEARAGQLEGEGAA